MKLNAKLFLLFAICVSNHAHAQSYEELLLISPDGKHCTIYESKRERGLDKYHEGGKGVNTIDYLNGDLYRFPQQWTDVSERYHDGGEYVEYPTNGVSRIRTADYLIGLEPSSMSNEDILSMGISSPPSMGYYSKSTDKYVVNSDASDMAEGAGDWERGAIFFDIPPDFEIVSHNDNKNGEWKVSGNLISFYFSNANHVSATVHYRKRSEAIHRDSIVNHYIDLESKYSSLDINCDDLMHQYRSLKATTDSLAEANRLLQASKTEAIARFRSMDKDGVQVSASMMGVRLGLSETILFASGKADVTPAGMQVISKIASKLQSAGKYKLVVTGHTDNVPVNKQSAFGSNWKLSAARAASVSEILMSDGVPESSIDVRAKGPSEPKASNETPEGRAQNRRIEIDFVPAQ